MTTAAARNAYSRGCPDCFECKYGGLGHPCRTAEGDYDIGKAGAAMLDRFRLVSLPDDPPLEAIDRVDWIVDCQYELVEDHAHLIVPLMVAAMNACRTAQEAAWLAAGYIEDALVRRGPEIIAEVEVVAKASAKARYILSGVWRQVDGIESEVWRRLGVAVGEGPHIDNDPRAPNDGSPRRVLAASDADILMADPIASLV